MSSPHSESPTLPGGFSTSGSTLLDASAVTAQSSASSSSFASSSSRRDRQGSSGSLTPSPSRPDMGPRALSHNAALPAPSSRPASPYKSSQNPPSRRPSTTTFSDGGSQDQEVSTSSRRAAMDRIKSRAVDSGWNWEAERAKVEAEQLRAGASSPHGGEENRTAPTDRPVAPPRHSSRPPPGTTARPRIDTSNQGTASPRPGSPRKDDAESAATPTPTAVTANVPPPQRTGQTSTTSSGKKEQLCDACGKPMTGQFVRALGVVFHLDCFRCRDCNKVVASKFFPATEEMKDSSPTNTQAPDGTSKTVAPTQKLFPLCETDYFRRLDLLCAKCGGALRGSYITALGSKFHVEHFTCSICPTVFGPQDSYYEHDGKVFCHFHYSTRFAIRCTGCRTAILKQFVEINRNNQDEHWHPECYMIHKFWNIKLCPTGATPKESVANEPTTVSSAPPPSNSGVAPVTNALATDEPSPEALETEANETPSSLKKKQRMMEEQVYRIWTVLSAFEESSAACISEMLRHVSSGRYLGGVRMAERFILHVEILFSAIDDIEKQFRKEQTKGISHIREARMLCKKIVNFFSLLSHTQETGARRMGITQELLSLVTGLAHYLKILIRIALTGALKLDRDYGNRRAILWFLDQLAYLAEKAALSGDERTSNGEKNDIVPTSEISMQGPDGKWYGYRSLPRSTSASSSDGNEGATDLCVSCGQTVEEECVRMGINMRWHTSCLRCCQCKRRAYKESSSSSRRNAAEPTPDVPTLPASEFALEVKARPPTSEGTQSSSGRKLFITYCAEHAPQGIRRGFETGTRLEQYAFLLRVALNRLYALLKKRGVVPASPPALAPSGLPTSESASSVTSADGKSSDSYRDSTDIKRMKSVNLDRKLSTKAKVPRISTVVGSPSGQQTLATSMQQRISPTGESGSRTPSPKQASGEGFDGSDSRVRSRSPAEGMLRRSPSPGALPPPPPEKSRSRDVSPRRPEPGSVRPIRPAFARHNTDVQIREDGPVRQPSGDDRQDPLAHAEEGLTLADIPQLLEAEQAREQHRPLPNEGRSLSELSALELFIVKHMAVMMLQQSALKDMVPMDDLIEFIEMRKNTFWGKLFKGGKDKKKIEKKGVFGIPLEMLVERSGADSTLGASTTHLRVPSFVDDIISAMKQMDVSVEGIFRKNGNIRRLKELSEALDRDSAAVNLSDDNPVQLAALLKKFLRELPDPLLTFKLHRLFVMSQKLEPEPERLRILHLVTILLPKAHRDTLEVLFVFLKWVASFSHVDEETGSKMDLQNLALVLGPNILYAKSADPAKDELFLANRAILCLLENQDDFWLVPPELEAVLQDRELLNASAELTSRDILKRCEKYAKRAKTFGSGSSGGNGSGHRGPGPHMHLDAASRQQRPEYHDPVTMRQVESQHFSNGMVRTNSGYPRSPVDDDGGPGSRPPWAGRDRDRENNSQQQTYYGSPDRSHYHGPQQQPHQHQAQSFAAPFQHHPHQFQQHSSQPGTPRKLGTSASTPSAHQQYNDDEGKGYIGQGPSVTQSQQHVNWQQHQSRQQQA